MSVSRRRALSTWSCVLALAAFGVLAAGESQAAAANHDVQRRDRRASTTVRHDRAACPMESASAGDRTPG